MGRAPKGQNWRVARVVARDVEVTVESLGARGDGLAHDGGSKVYVPFTLPGERVAARITDRRGGDFLATATEILDASPGRARPSCPHFGTCGGCVLQHMKDEAYAKWKREALIKAVQSGHLGVVKVKPMIHIPEGTRRRAVFSVLRGPQGVRLGFRERQSHHIVDVIRCELLTRKINDLLGPLRDLIAGIGRPVTKTSVTETGGGLDLLLEGPQAPGLDARERLAAFAEDRKLARLSWHSTGQNFLEPISARQAAQVLFGGVPVTLPPGGFLQPSLEGEAAITAAVLEGVEGARAIADLFCGIGTFTFPLSRFGRVHGVEGAREAVEALKNAANKAGATRVTVEHRNLADRPLAVHELAKFDAVVFDPPRAGAKEQVQQLAEAGQAGKGPKTIVAVSCHPATFFRDARILLSGGYRCKTITPIDQFPYSGHIELVAVFGR